MTHETATTEAVMERMICGIATLMTVASASVRKMPGRTAMRTSQLRAGLGPASATGLMEAVYMLG